MPSRFYSENKKDALQRIREYIPNPVANPTRLVEQLVQTLSDVMDCRIPLYHGAARGTSLGQPLFFRSPPPPSTEPEAQLPQAAGCTVSHEKVFNQYRAHQEAPSGSSPAQAPLKAPGIVTPSLEEHSEDVENTPSWSQTLTPINETQGNNMDEADSGGDDPAVALVEMDTQFSKWTQSKREGVDAVTGIVMGAPTNAPASLVQWYEESWATKAAK